MNIPFIDLDTLLFIKSNIDQYLENFTLPTNDWIYQEIESVSFSEMRYCMPDIKLDMSEEKSFLTDVTNVQIIYENMRFLSDSQAADERIWAGLSLGPFWEYVQYRWGIKKKNTRSNIEQHFFFGFGARRSLTRNAIARLWWIGRLTYDEKKKDPYEVTKFVCENADYIMHILERNTSNNPVIISAFVSGIIEMRQEGMRIDTDIVGELAKYLNLLGGTYILDCMHPEKIKEKVKKKAKEIAK